MVPSHQVVNISNVDNKLAHESRVVTLMYAIRVASVPNVGLRIIAVARITVVIDEVIPSIKIQLQDGRSSTLESASTIVLSNSK
jgi:hypothetical protein